ncbi:metal tolerance protein C2-like isoform X2 [Pyrus x bretschneideri]|uniref:metal tolerance protein C2-like isoform X2 n=1 Tax=Pyrus x bretschneideri TaxID=225117 RepID=UPI002030B454|nr:metal tolerance protein C2-like isoform X2 [Pyrus x bretschneideri]
MDKSNSFKASQNPWSADFGLGATDRRLAFSRQASFQPHREPPHTPVSINLNDSEATPFLSRSVSSIDVPPGAYLTEESDKIFGGRSVSAEKLSVLVVFESVFRILRSGNRYMKRLFLLISLNVAYSTVELFIGLFTGRIGLVSDSFHLSFGCGLLTFSLFAMAASRKKPDEIYTYGYKRLQVLSAFTNALFLLFMSFSLAVEALHAFIQDESEHKHYLIVSAVTNLLVNLIGVWFFRNYARVNLVYRHAEDMNNHSVCLHVLADSIRRVDIGILVSVNWNAEVLCFGLVSVAVFMLVMPLFRASGGILLQMAPPNVPPSALSKCWRQITACEDVSEVSQARFWELVPGHVVGSLSVQVKKGIDDRPVLRYVHGLYHDLGIQDLTVQADSV